MQMFKYVSPLRSQNRRWLMLSGWFLPNSFQNKDEYEFLHIFDENKLSWIHAATFYDTSHIFSGVEIQISTKKVIQFSR